MASGGNQGQKWAAPVPCPPTRRRWRFHSTGTRSALAIDLSIPWIYTRVAAFDAMLLAAVVFFIISDNGVWA